MKYLPMQADVGQLVTDFRDITTVAHWWAIFMPAAERDSQTAAQGFLSDCNCTFNPSEDDLTQTSRNLLGCLSSELRNKNYSLLQ